jgi:hypothetical protein
MHNIDAIEFPLISRNIITGKETEHDTLTKIQFQWKTSITTLRHYIDRHKQYQGHVLRSGYNKPYWILPENFKFSNVIGQTTQNVFIKRVDKVTNEVAYYNSISEAAMFLQQEIDHVEFTKLSDEANILRKALGELLRGFPTKKPIINRYEWYRMKEIGYIVNPDGSKVCIDEAYEDTPEKQIVVKEPVVLPTKEYSDRMFENKAAIIVRDIYTGEEDVFNEGYSHVKFYEKYKIIKNTLKNKYLNIPLNYGDFTFRTLDQPYWQIPENYITNEEEKVRLEYFIKIEELETGKFYYYNSIAKMSEHLFPLLNYENVRRAIYKKFMKNDINSVNENTRKGEMSILFSKYKWTKLESCGSLVYPDGNTVNIEKLLIK